MAKIEIDTSKWLKPIIAIVSTVILMFVGYKVFVAKEWSFDPQAERKLIITQEEVRKLKDSITVINRKNDSISKINEAKYRVWKKKGIAFDNLKKKFDEERENTNNLSINERVRLFSEWINDTKD